MWQIWCQNVLNFKVALSHKGLRFGFINLLNSLTSITQDLTFGWPWPQTLKKISGFSAPKMMLKYEPMFDFDPFWFSLKTIRLNDAHKKEIHEFCLWKFVILIQDLCNYHCTKIRLTTFPRTSFHPKIAL